MMHENLALLTVEDTAPVILREMVWEDGGEDIRNGRDPDPDFYEENDAIWSSDGRMIANFTLCIVAERQWVDDEKIIGRDLCMILTKNGNYKKFWITSDQFAGQGLLRKIYEVQGGDAIINGSVKELRIAVQLLSPKARLTLQSHATNGFTADGRRYLSAPAIELSERGVRHLEVEDVRLFGAYGSRIRFDLADHEEQVDLARHLVTDFLELKKHDITYPLMAHITLSPFSSLITSITGKQKPAMHLQGVSGGGKTFLVSRAADFFGDFDGQLPSWSSTANALETLGYEAKDALFVLDDFKPGLTSEADFQRVLQNHANGHGRMRLAGRHTTAPYIRGLLLSTGESFVKDAESVAARTVLIDVDDVQNQQAGQACLERRLEYPRFLPGLIHHVLARPNWAGTFRDFVDDCVQYFLKTLPSFPNNLRIASNWALNAAGFWVFLEHLRFLGAISNNCYNEMAAEYLSIAETHIKAYSERMAAMNPAEVFHDVVSQKLASGAVSVAGVEKILGIGGELGNGEGKCIGKVTKEGLYFFPDVIMEILTRHFAARNTPMPFTMEGLKNSLLREKHLLRMGSGRLTTQVRLRGWKATAWKVRADFLSVGLEEDDELEKTS